MYRAGLSGMLLTHTESHDVARLFALRYGRQCFERICEDFGGYEQCIVYISLESKQPLF